MKHSFPNAARFHTEHCQWAPEGSRCPCKFNARISMFSQREQHSRTENCQDCKSAPWAVWHTLLWSPSKSCRKLAWVPVVPFTPRKRRSSRARSRFCRSMHKSWIHKQQRFPTVVSWAGLKTTKNTTWLIEDLHKHHTSLLCLPLGPLYRFILTHLSRN